MPTIEYSYLDIEYKADFVCFLQEINSLFVPALDTKTDLTSFSNKILTLGHVLVAKSNDTIIGVCCFYTNDLTSYKAYISLLGVKSAFSGRHVATEMLSMVTEYIKSTKMKTIAIHTNNPIAKHIYEKNGFLVLSSEGKDPDRYYLEKRL